MHDPEDFHDDGLARLGDRLRTERPELTALELDGVRRRVHARIAVPQARKRTRSGFMKSRLAILGTLVLGMLFSTTGAGLAISGFADGNNASVAQYGPGPGGQVLPGSNSGGSPGTKHNNNAVSPETATSPQTNTTPNQQAVSPAHTLQPTSQVEAGSAGSSNQLPFTGFAAIPVILGGVALLTGGLVMRRRSADQPER